MLYTLEGSKNSNGKRVFRFKDTQGNFIELQSADVKEMMANGDVFTGVRLTADDRLIIDVAKTSTASLAKNVFVSSSKNGCAVYSGDDLQAYTAGWTQGFHKRYAVEEILDRLHNYVAGKVCVVKGLRRTGKTTAIMQAIEELATSGVPYLKIGYVLVVETNADIDALISLVQKSDWDYVFIDEITHLSGLLNKLKWFSDVLAVPKKIVLAGTDSYVWPLAVTDVLYGRTLPVDLTYMSLREYAEVFPHRIKGFTSAETVNHFCRYGGVVDEREYVGMDNAFVSLQTALVENIANTITRNNDHSSVKDKVGLLYTVTKEQLTEAVICAVLQAAQTQNNEVFRTSGVKIPELAARLLEKQDMYKAQGIKADVVNRLMTALIELNVISKISNVARAVNGITPDTTSVLTCHISSLYNTLMGESELILNEPVVGAALENLILSQCVQFAAFTNTQYQRVFGTKDIMVGYSRYNDAKATESQNRTPEIDIVVRHRESNKLVAQTAVEIKSSSEPLTSHARNFFLPSTEVALGKIDKYVVVYMGETQQHRDVYYVNSYDFLMDIGKYVI